MKISRRLQGCVCSVQGPLLVTRLHTLPRQKCSPWCVSAMDVRINTCQHQANKSGKQQMHRVSVAIHKIDETSRCRLRVCVCVREGACARAHKHTRAAARLKKKKERFNFANSCQSCVYAYRPPTRAARKGSIMM